MPLAPGGAGRGGGVNGTAHAGMAQYARWLRTEVGPSLRALAAAGYAVTVTGHSMCGGVATLFTALERVAPPPRLTTA